ncbi:uncharacterized protein VP01_1910g5 [Puccinia sorghi]|uniref:Uncharacterized protein n=1 Tax=Puccinia sorghi TaxID=27349 RepID=A0A0L6VEL5_9BASI|nr:uncharacterized protein VP01_1910g5 [Puccinia sorghi]
MDRNMDNQDHDDEEVKEMVAVYDFSMIFTYLRSSEFMIPLAIFTWLALATILIGVYWSHIEVHCFLSETPCADLVGFFLKRPETSIWCPQTNIKMILTTSNYKLEQQYNCVIACACIHNINVLWNGH